MKHVIRILPLLVLVALVWPGSLRATERQRDSSRLKDHLATLELKAAQANRTAQELESLNRNRSSWESHAYYLNSLRESVNAMGALLQQLEGMKPAAADLQARAIEQARPHLEEFAARVQGAITGLNENRRVIIHPDYRDGLRQLASNSQMLSQKLDAILDHHETGMRLAELDISLD